MFFFVALFICQRVTNRKSSKRNIGFQAPAEKASGGRLEAIQVMLESLSPQQRGHSVARRALLSACEVDVGGCFVGPPNKGVVD